MKNDLCNSPCIRRISKQTPKSQLIASPALAVSRDAAWDWVVRPRVGRAVLARFSPTPVSARNKLWASRRAARRRSMRALVHLLTGLISLHVSLCRRPRVRRKLMSFNIEEMRRLCEHRSSLWGQLDRNFWWQFVSPCEKDETYKVRIFFYEIMFAIWILQLRWCSAAVKVSHLHRECDKLSVKSVMRGRMHRCEFKSCVSLAWSENSSKKHDF